MLKAGPRELRIILQIKKGRYRRVESLLLSIDQSPDRGAGMEATSFSLGGNHIKVAISQIRGSYDGTLSDHEKTITGTFTQGLPILLEFRAGYNKLSGRFQK